MSLSVILQPSSLPPSDCVIVGIHPISNLTPSTNSCFARFLRPTCWGSIFWAPLWPNDEQRPTLDFRMSYKLKLKPPGCCKSFWVCIIISRWINPSITPTTSVYDVSLFTIYCVHTSASSLSHILSYECVFETHLCGRVDLFVNICAPCGTNNTDWQSSSIFPGPPFD